jgi:hypothetical protein
MLPKNLKYGSKVESAMARSYRTNLAPQNGTGPYNLGDTIILNIPTRNNLVLVPSESYLKFKVTATAAGASNYFRWDACGAHGAIQRIRVFHGSNLLQDIDNYGMLCKMLYDIQVPTASNYGKNNIMIGTRNDTTVTLPSLATPATPATSDLTAFGGAKLSVFQTNTGERIGGNGALTASGATASEIYTLNLVSLIGSLCSANYLPLFEMTSAPLRVEIQLVNGIQKALACSNATSTMALSNVEYVGNFIELGDSAMGMIRSSLNGSPLQLVFPDYRNYNGSYPLPVNTSASVFFPIPAKFSSLKALFVSTRDQNDGAATYFPFSAVKVGMTQYQFRVGSQVVPSKPPDNVPEYFCELLKAIGSISDLNSSPSIDKISYALDYSVINNESFGTNNNLTTYGISASNSGSFYVGLDLENYSSANKESIFAGYNSNTDDIYFNPTYLYVAGGNIRLDAFANFDAVLVCQNDTAYVNF